MLTFTARRQKLLSAHFAFSLVSVLALLASALILLGWFSALSSGIRSFGSIDELSGYADSLRRYRWLATTLGVVVYVLGGFESLKLISTTASLGIANVLLSTAAFGSTVSALVIWGLDSELSRNWLILFVGLLFMVGAVAIYVGILVPARRRVIRSAILFAGTTLSILGAPVSFLLLNRQVDWYLPVQVTGLLNGQERPMRFFHATKDKVIVMVPTRAEPESFIIVLPGAGHRSEGFKGLIYPCKYVLSPLLFAATSPYLATCAAPLETGNTLFTEGSIEFSSPKGNRLKLQWKTGPFGLPLPSN